MKNKFTIRQGDIDGSYIIFIQEDDEYGDKWLSECPCRKDARYVVRALEAYYGKKGRIKNK